MDKLYFITSNKNKFTEVKAILGEVEQLEMDLPEIQELNPKKIIEEKLKEAIKYHKGPLIVEDVSLNVESLNGLPGPFIKWFEKTIKPEGIYNLAKKLGNTNAVAKTIFGLANKGNINYFDGEVKGRLVSPRGKNGFGFDFIFMPDGHNKTYSQMSAAKKNSLSHRKIALEKLKEFLKK